MKLISRVRSEILWSMCVVLPAAVAWAGPVVKSEAVFDPALGVGVAKIVVRPDANEDFQRWHAQLPWVQGSRVHVSSHRTTKATGRLGSSPDGTAVWDASPNRRSILCSRATSHWKYSSRGATWHSS